MARPRDADPEVSGERSRASPAASGGQARSSGRPGFLVAGALALITPALFSRSPPTSGRRGALAKQVLEAPLSRRREGGWERGVGE